MTLETLMGMLREKLGGYTPRVERVAQIEWDRDDPDSPPPLPYALVVPETTEDVFAGGANRLRLTPYRVELYTRFRDMALEGAIEDALIASQTKFVRRTVPLGHGVVETTYTVTVMGR